MFQCPHCGCHLDRVIELTECGLRRRDIGAVIVPPSAANVESQMTYCDTTSTAVAVPFVFGTRCE